MPPWPLPSLLFAHLLLRRREGCLAGRQGQLLRLQHPLVVLLAGLGGGWACRARDEDTSGAGEAGGGVRACHGTVLQHCLGRM